MTKRILGDFSQRTAFFTEINDEAYTTLQTELIQ